MVSNPHKSTAALPALPKLEIACFQRHVNLCKKDLEKMVVLKSCVNLNTMFGYLTKLQLLGKAFELSVHIEQPGPGVYDPGHTCRYVFYAFLGDLRWARPKMQVFVRADLESGSALSLAQEDGIVSCDTNFGLIKVAIRQAMFQQCGEVMLERLERICIRDIAYMFELGADEGRSPEQLAHLQDSCDAETHLLGDGEDLELWPSTLPKRARVSGKDRRARDKLALREGPLARAMAAMMTDKEREKHFQRVKKKMSKLLEDGRGGAGGRGGRGGKGGRGGRGGAGGGGRGGRGGRGGKGGRGGQGGGGRGGALAAAAAGAIGADDPEGSDDNDSDHGHGQESDDEQSAAESSSEHSWESWEDEGLAPVEGADALGPADAGAGAGPGGAGGPGAPGPAGPGPAGPGPAFPGPAGPAEPSRAELS